MTNNKQTYKPHDKTISPFSDFIINSTDEEKKRVFEVACELANQDQRNMIERANNKQTWIEKYNRFVGGSVKVLSDEYANCYALPFNYPKDIEQFIAKTLQEQREEISDDMRNLIMPLQVWDGKKKEWRIEMSDEKVRKLDTFLKQLKK